MQWVDVHGWDKISIGKLMQNYESDELPKTENVMTRSKYLVKDDQFHNLQLKPNIEQSFVQQIWEFAGKWIHTDQRSF